jgi:malic enzyme
VVYEGREVLMDEWKAIYAQATDKRILRTSIEGADVFLGLSAAGVLKPEMLAKMAERPLIMALANPSPEIMPDAARSRPARRDDLHRTAISPIRSTTSCVFPISSAARSIAAHAPSTKK